MLCSTDENPLKVTNIERYKIIDGLRDSYPIESLCQFLNITSRAYRKWIAKGKPLMNNYCKTDANIIEVEHYKMKEVYGTLRLKHHIENKYGIVFNHKKIIRYKKVLGLQTVTRTPNPISNKLSREKNLAYMAKNKIECNFQSEAPYHKLSTDVSYIQCTDGRLYLSAVKDLFNNQIIAYNVSERNDVDLVIDTINQLPHQNGIIHSDQGSAYYSWEYRNKLQELGYERSMSRAGACWENSPIENWFSQIKEEELRRIGKQSKNLTKDIIKEYVLWYNTERIQKDLRYKSPIQFLNESFFI